MQRGAAALAGGQAFGNDATAFYQPTVLAGVRPGMAAFGQETFGPVAAMVIADDAEHALALANDNAFGLSGAIWTADLDRANPFTPCSACFPTRTPGLLEQDLPVTKVASDWISVPITPAMLRGWVELETVPLGIVPHRRPKRARAQ